MLGCTEWKVCSSFMRLHSFVTLNSPVSCLHYIPLSQDLSISGVNDAPEYPPPCIHLLFLSSFLTKRPFFPPSAGAGAHAGGAEILGLLNSCPPVLQQCCKELTLQSVEICSYTSGCWGNVSISMIDPLINTTGLHTQKTLKSIGTKCF